MVLAITFFLTAGCSSSTTNQMDETLPMETERKILHEVFTGSTCGPCFDADAIILDLFDANPERYVHISYHVGGDPYISSESVARRMLYVPEEMDTYSIPWLQVDGIHGFHPVEVNDDAGYLQEDFDTFAKVPSTVIMEASHNITEKSVDIQISVLPLQDNFSTELFLHVAIIENTTSLNEGTNGLTEFHHVMKKMLPDENGTPLPSLKRGEEVTYEFSYTFQGDYDDSTSINSPVDHNSAHTVEEFDDLSVVVFIQDTASTEVLQAFWSE